MMYDYETKKFESSFGVGVGLNRVDDSSTLSEISLISNKLAGLSTKEYEVVACRSSFGRVQRQCRLELVTLRILAKVGALLLQHMDLKRDCFMRISNSLLYSRIISIDLLTILGLICKVQSDQRH